MAARSSNSLLDEKHFVEQLRAFKGFKHLDASVWGSLTGRIRQIRLASGEVLFRQGDAGDAVYVVLRGRLTATLIQGDGGEVPLSEMSSGGLIGEIQLLTGGARTATVRAVEACELLRIPTEVGDELLRRSPETRRKMLAMNRRRLQRSLLAEVLPDLLGPLDEDALSFLQSVGEWLELRRGETLFEEGASGDACFLLLHGRLIALPRDSSGEAQATREMGRGEFVGEMAVVTGEPRTMTVRAVRDSQVLRLSSANFERLVARYPQVLMAITRNLVGRLQQATARPEGRQTSGETRTIALVRATRGAPWSQLAESLAVSLSAWGRTLVLDRERIAESLGLKAQLSGDAEDPANMRLSAWLDDQELAHRFVLYVADARPSAWSRRCVRQADVILVVAEAGEAVEVASVARFLLQDAGPDGDGETASDRSRLVLLYDGETDRPRATGRLLASLRLHRHHHLRWRRSEDIDRLGRLLAGRSVGLVLGGGGARGFAHIGVLRALHEAEITIDAVGGTSLGALIAAQAAMGWDAGTMLDVNLRAFVGGRPHRAFTLPLVSVVSDRRGARMIAGMFQDLEIEDLWFNYFAVSANLTTAEQVIHQQGSLGLALKATSAIPGVFAPAVRGGELLVDGGLLNNLPGDVMRRLWGGRIVSVDVSPANDLRVDDQLSGMPSAWSILRRWLNPLAARVRAPNILEILTRASTLPSVRQTALAKRDADLYLEPPVGQFKMFDMSELDQLAEIGYEYAKERLSDWQS